MNDKMEKLVDICCRWNRRDLDSSEAMNMIWKLFNEENLKAWRKGYAKANWQELVYKEASV